MILLEMFEDLHVIRISPIKFDGDKSTRMLAVMPELSLASFSTHWQVSMFQACYGYRML